MAIFGPTNSEPRLVLICALVGVSADVLMFKINTSKIQTVHLCGDLMKKVIKGSNYE